MHAELSYFAEVEKETERSIGCGEVPCLVVWEDGESIVALFSSSFSYCVESFAEYSRPNVRTK